MTDLEVIQEKLDNFHLARFEFELTGVDEPDIGEAHDDLNQYIYFVDGIAKKHSKPFRNLFEGKKGADFVEPTI